jgi:uncharacterized protein YndB with AHSA1/START domain
MSQEKIEFLSALLLISKNPEGLSNFYKDVIGLPIKVEEHGETLKHYGCELGDLHFAIHPPENFSDKNIGVGAVKLAFTVFDMKSFVSKVETAGYKFEYPPKDIGFAIMTAIHDPDGNYVEFTQLSDGWFKHLDKRKSQGIDVVQRWKSLKGELKKMSTPIRHSNYIDVGPDLVYETLTTAEGWNAWFTTGMELDLKPQGTIHFKWKNFGPTQDTVEDKGTVIEFEPNRSLTFLWHPQGENKPTQVKFYMEPKGNGTHLKLEETGYLDTPEGHAVFNSCATGWGEAMTLLKFYLEKGLTYTQPGKGKS